MGDMPVVDLSLLLLSLAGFIADDFRLIKSRRRYLYMKNMAAKSKNHPQENLKLCDMPRYKADSSTFTMVIFGGAGDLSQRKLIPNLYQ